MKIRSVIFATTLLLAVAASASGFYIPKHGQKCGAHWGKRTVRIRERHHGQLVYRHGHAIIVKQVRCYWVPLPRVVGKIAPAG